MRLSERASERCCPAEDILLFCFHFVGIPVCLQALCLFHPPLGAEESKGEKHVLQASFPEQKSCFVVAAITMNEHPATPEDFWLFNSSVRSLLAIPPLERSRMSLLVLEIGSERALGAGYGIG